MSPEKASKTMRSKQKYTNLPNYITISRIVMIPLIVSIYYLPSAMSMESKNILALVVFCLAALTDWLDGYLARKLRVESNFGAFLDPLADKLIVSIMLVLLFKLKRIDIIPLLVIISREFVISGLREWMARIGESASVKVSNIGKIKTTFQLISIALLLGTELTFFNAISTYEIGTFLLWGAVLLTVASMVDYINKAAETIKWIKLKKIH